MTRISAAVWVGGLLLVCGCGTPPRTTPVKRTATAVSASVERTRTAAIEEFAKWNIPVQTQDPKAGTLASFGVLVTGADTTWADCGRTQGGDQGRPQLPNVGRYVATILGDSAASTIKIDVVWLSGSGAIVKECVSRGIWETRFEHEVKSMAEQH